MSLSGETLRDAVSRGPWPESQVSGAARSAARTRAAARPKAGLLINTRGVFGSSRRVRLIGQPAPTLIGRATHALRVQFGCSTLGVSRARTAPPLGWMVASPRV